MHSELRANSNINPRAYRYWDCRYLTYKGHATGASRARADDRLILLTMVRDDEVGIFVFVVYESRVEPQQPSALVARLGADARGPALAGRALRLRPAFNLAQSLVVLPPTSERFNRA